MRFVRLVALVVILALVGCNGSYRITYRMPSNAEKPRDTTETKYAHGVGPLIVGGGLFFMIFDSMSPALVDWTGGARTETICPEGFSEISHYHTRPQGFYAGLISFFALVNWYHLSTVDWKCVGSAARY